MSQSQLGASAHSLRNRKLNCRVGRIIAIPQPIGDNPLASLDMLDDIPPVHILAEAFDREFGSSRDEKAGRVLDFERK